MKLSQKLFDFIPNITIKDGEGLKRLNRAGDIMGRPMQNRLIMGATAIISQPFIDEHNKRVDKKTARASRNRTIGKILAGTAVGCVVRGGIYKLVNATTDKDISIDRWNNLLTPRNSTKIMPHLFKNRMRNYRTVSATLISLVAMLFTNILIDMPLTNKISNFLNKLDNQKYNNNTNTPSSQPQIQPHNPRERMKYIFNKKGGISMKISRHLKSVTSYLFEHCSKDIGSMIIWTTIAGWIASSTAQIIGIYKNSKYTNSQKKFMINQELADAGMNILSYFAITMPTKAFAKKLVTTGKILPRSVKTVIRQAKDGKKIGNIDFDISKQTYFSKIEKPFNSFSNFMGTSAAVLGGTISSNIVTPILRNRFASKRQAMPSRFDTREDTTKTTISPLKTNSGFNNFRKTSMSI